MGYNIIIFSAGIDNIPTDFYEAARIDGASRAKSFFYITLPLLARTFSFVLAMTLISHFQMFAQFQIMARSGGGEGGPNNAAMVMTLYTWRTAFDHNNMGYASAVAVALFVVIMVVTVFQQRLNRVDWGY
jgi:multiple sugar transport system permease protein/raffinose/stachyose/melibiose transport system permease protein